MNDVQLIWEYVIKDRLSEENIQSAQKKCVTIWGHGECGVALRRILDQLAIPVNCFLDMRVEKQTRNSDLDCKDPRDFLEKSVDALVILTMKGSKAICRKEKKEYPKCRFMCFSEYLLELTGSTIPILEIGPYSYPVFVGAGVKYADIFTADELFMRAQKTDDYDPDGVPETIDFVLRDGNLNCVHEHFEYIYSSHLIEHQIDLVRHLHDAERILNPGGRYLLAIPDKRFCSNHFSMESGIEDVLVAYLEKRTEHTLQAYLNSILLATHNDAELHWRDDHGKPSLSAIQYKECYQAFIERRYKDLHEWYFTPNGFGEIIRSLCQLELTGFKLEAIYETNRNSLTFFAVLKKGDEKAEQ